jgi:hypothetical protein
MGTTAEKSEEKKSVDASADSDASDKTTVYWSLLMVGVFISCSLLGIIAQRAYQGSSLAEQTRLMKKCRANPAFNPAVCASLLNDEEAVRAATDTFRGKHNRKAVFQLSGNDDDLTPPPGFRR